MAITIDKIKAFDVDMYRAIIRHFRGHNSGPFYDDISEAIIVAQKNPQIVLLFGLINPHCDVREHKITAIKLVRDIMFLCQIPNDGLREVKYAADFYLFLCDMEDQS